MPILPVYVDMKTIAILEKVALERGRTVAELAEAAVAEAALQSERGGR